MHTPTIHSTGWLSALVFAGSIFIAPLANADSESEESPIEINNLHFGETLYHFYQNKYFTAISDLLVAQKKHPITSQASEPDLLLGGLYLSYNMASPAENIFKRLARVESNKRIYSSAWYYLSRLAYERGDLIRAQQTANKVGIELPYRYNDEFQHLRSNILLKQNKYRAAIKLLENFSGTTEWSTYAKFNLAIALVLSDEQTQGINLLEEVASIETYDLEQLALRDKANLALGYSALRAKQHDAAAAYFKQIRLVGSQSNKALLGVGWAYHKEGELKRALVPWIELKNRGSKDPSVQEALLTIPHALEGLNAKKQALAYYTDAINSYNSELTSINNVITAVNSGEFINALRALHLHQQKENHLHFTALPDSIATPYLQGLIAEQHFQNIMKTYRDLLHMKNVLMHWNNQMPAYKLMLKERQKTYLARVPLIKDFHSNSRESMLAERYKNFKDDFEQINPQSDIIALANEKEMALIRILQKVKRILDKAPQDELVKQREQYNLLKGLIHWQIAEEYSVRHWQVKKQLIKIERTFAELQKKKKSSRQVLATTPDQFDHFAKRISDKDRQIQQLTKRIDKTIQQQENHINHLVTSRLQKQKLQIENYHIRASYSLTRLYDNLAAVEKKP